MRILPCSGQLSLRKYQKSSVLRINSDVCNSLVSTPVWFSEKVNMYCPFTWNQNLIHVARELCHRCNRALSPSHCSMAEEKERNYHVSWQCPIHLDTILNYRGYFLFLLQKIKSLKWKAKFTTPEGWVNLKNTVTNCATIKNLIKEICLLTQNIIHNILCEKCTL